MRFPILKSPLWFDLRRRHRSLANVPIRFATVLLLGGGLWAPSDAHAQVLDAIKGHFRDLKDRMADHQVIEGEILKRGEIDTTAKGQDFLHNASGNWTLVRADGVLYLQSDRNFRSSPGPDYHVYISRSPAIKDNDEFSEAQIEVGRLTKPNGAAFYRLAVRDPEQVRSLLIWCKRFREYIGSADLR